MISAGTAFAADGAAADAVDDEADAVPVISDVDVASDEQDNPETDELILNETDDVLSAANAKNTQFIAADNLVYNRPIVAGGYGLYPIELTTAGNIPIPLSNKAVSIEFNGVKKNYNTNSIGLVDYYIPANTPSGTYKINMKFAGDGSYSGSQRTTTIKVVDVSIQIIAPENAAYPSPLVISGMGYYPIALTSNTTIPVPLANKVVRVNVNGVEGKYTTNEYGVFNYTLDSRLAPGVYPVEIAFDGGDGYNPTKFSTNVEVYDVPTQIVALKNASYPISLVAKSLAYYPIELTTDISINVTNRTIPIPVPLANKIVKVRFNGGDYSKYVTDEYGFFNYTLDSGLASGNYSIEISYDGDKGYIGSHFDANVEVYDASTQIIAADNVSYPHPLVAEGHGYYPITLATGTAIPIPMANKTVTVEFNGASKKFVTDGYGIINYVIPDAPAGNYTINMVFDGYGRYAGSSLTANVGIYDVETKFVAPENVTYGASDVREGVAFYPILLTTDTSVPVPLANKIVSVEFNGAVSKHTTNEVGLINYVIPVGAPAGNLTVKMAFDGKGGYASINSTGKVEIIGINTKIIAPSRVTVMVKDLNSTCFNLTLLDANGNKLANQAVSIEFNGASEDYVTDRNGAIHYPLSGAPAGTHVISMNYAGAGNYTASSASSTIVVASTQKPTKIYLRNALYFVLQTKYVTVTLWDGNNNPIAGKTVHITLNEYGLKYSGVTDENGEASIRVGVGFGVHSATVSFDGDDFYSASERTGSIRVIKETPSVMVRGADSQFKVGDNPKIVKVYLRDRYNKPLLEGTKIFLRVNGQQFVGLTDSQGIAHVEVKLNSAGTFDAQAIYMGNTAYNAVTRDIKLYVK